MLTIQPKITSYSRPVVSFKGDEDFYKSKVDYYTQQYKDFDEMAQDPNSPKGLRKVMKGFAVVAEALLEGWAVAWGASKGAKVLRTPIKNFVNGKFVKHIKDIVRPLTNGVKDSASTITEKITKTADQIKTSKFAEKLTNIVNKMKENKVGRYVVKAFEYVGKAFKYVGNLVKNGANKVTEYFKGKTAGQLYDKGARAASVTMGVGAGAAGAYNAATNAQERKEAYYHDRADGDAELGE